MYEAYPIADFQSGVKTDKEPWLNPNEALTRLMNGHVYRGRISKRPAAKFLDKLGTKVIAEGKGTPGAGLRTVGNWPAAPAVSTHSVFANLPLAPPTVVPIDRPITLVLPPYSFRSIGPEISPNVYALEWFAGTALTQPYTARVNVATGEWYVIVDPADAVFTAAAGSATYEFYRGLSPMLITEWVNAGGTRELVVCDTKRLFVWNVARLRFDDKLATGATLATDDVFTAPNTEFFSAASVDDGSSRKLVIVNGIDLPKKWDGSVLADMGVSSQLTAARFVFAQYGHVIYLTPKVGGDTNRQRAMWSDQFLTETVQAANYAVVFTGERMICATIVNDEIIVFFDRSVHKLRYTGDFRTGAQFEWQHVAGGDTDRQRAVGAVAAMGLVGLPDRAIAVSVHGISEANNVQVVYGGLQVPNLMKDLVDPTKMSISYGCAFDDEQKVIFSAT
ncbi:MAG: hypothetical protein ACREJT_03435, partial [Myxococcota bacterium]